MNEGLGIRWLICSQTEKKTPEYLKLFSLSTFLPSNELHLQKCDLCQKHLGSRVQIWAQLPWKRQKPTRSFIWEIWRMMWIFIFFGASVFFCINLELVTVHVYLHATLYDQLCLINTILSIPDVAIYKKKKNIATVCHFSVPETSHTKYSLYQLQYIDCILLHLGGGIHACMCSLTVPFQPWKWSSPKPPCH